MIGQALLIPIGEEAVGRQIRINGYAYPYIDDWILQQTLPYLTELSVFSYGFTPDGTLISSFGRCVYDCAGRRVSDASDSDADAVWQRRTV